MIQAVRGTKDLLPGNIEAWQFAESVFRDITTLYGYKELRSPIFEKTEVFSRGVGEGTDIVNKEMYTFEDRGGESLTLRPEATAALVRSVIQNSITQQNSVSRLWYFGPFFRYERPQKGRLRQFHQFGAECLSSPFPESDAEVLQLAHAVIKKLGIDEYKLMINTLGNDKSRSVYKEALVEYLMANRSSLSGESSARLEINPLRVLDSKQSEDAEVIKNAPLILDYLDNESKEHYDKVKSLLDESDIAYSETPRLVRGLDYYCHTVFEFQSTALGAQDSFGGGGRYNSLFTQLGGKETPAVGFAMGVERLLIILESLNKLPEALPECDVFIIAAGEAHTSIAMKIADKLRRKGLKTEVDLQRRSMKAQMRESNKSQAAYTCIIGDSEAEKSVVLIKNMADSSQIECPFDQIDGYDFVR